jgi:hypothetical protein
MLLHWRQFVGLPVGIFLTSVFLGVLGDMGQWTVLLPTLSASLNPRLFLFCAFILWNTWHFAAQHFAVLSIYRRTAGQRSYLDRRLDRWFSVAMTCVLTPMAWHAQDRSEFFGPLFGYRPSPSTMPALGTVVIVTAATLTIAYIVVEICKTDSSLPRGLYMVSIGIQPVFGTISFPTYHLAVFSICHWLIALALASRILDNEFIAGRRAAVWLRGLGLGFWMGMFAFVVASVVMNGIFHSQTMHRAVGIIAPVEYGDSSLFSYKTGVFQTAFGALSGAYFGISFVHFIYDRYVYALRRQEIREWIAPHLFSRSAEQQLG